MQNNHKNNANENERKTTMKRMRTGVKSEARRVTITNEGNAVRQERSANSEKTYEITVRQ